MLKSKYFFLLVSVVSVGFIFCDNDLPGLYSHKGGYPKSSLKPSADNKVNSPVQEANESKLELVVMTSEDHAKERTILPVSEMGKKEEANIVEQPVAQKEQVQEENIGGSADRKAIEQAIFVPLSEVDKKDSAVADQPVMVEQLQEESVSADQPVVGEQPQEKNAGNDNADQKAIDEQAASFNKNQKYAAVMQALSEYEEPVGTFERMRAAVKNAFNKIFRIKSEQKLFYRDVLKMASEAELSVESKNFINKFSLALETNDMVLSAGIREEYAHYLDGMRTELTLGTKLLAATKRMGNLVGDKKNVQDLIAKTKDFSILADAGSLHFRVTEMENKARELIESESVDKAKVADFLQEVVKLHSDTNVFQGKVMGALSFREKLGKKITAIDEALGITSSFEKLVGHDIVEEAVA
jgi:hypothetical protein